MDVRFFAGAAEAAGVEALTVDAAGMSGRDLVAHHADGNDRLAKVLGVSSLLADGARLTDLDAEVGGVASLDVLPPFAGG